ncbi:MAG: hypothetical protein WC683_04620 [bacterium]
MRMTDVTPPVPLRGAEVTAPTRPAATQPKMRVLRCPVCDRVLFKSVAGEATVEMRCRDCKTIAEYSFNHAGEIAYRIIERGALPEWKKNSRQGLDKPASGML